MKKTLIAATGGLVLLLGACTKDAGTSDYKKQTADFINGKQLADKAGRDFNDASCKEPASTAVGTQYTCTATDATDGSTWTFQVQITEKNGFTVTSGTSETGEVLGATGPSDGSTTSVGAATTTTA
jgi:hypothetical protein